MQYVPHDYQAFATEYILQHPVAAILLDMGLGKSVISLTAIFDLTLDSFSDSKGAGDRTPQGGSGYLANRN